MDGTRVAICISRPSAAVRTFLATKLPSALPHAAIPSETFSTSAQVCLIQIAACLPRGGSRIQEGGMVNHSGKNSKANNIHNLLINVRSNE